MPTHPARPGSAALRIGRCSLPGQAYFITFTTHARRPLFRDWAWAMAASRSLAHADNWTGARLLAWVLMPDHWHGLLVLGDQANLSKVVGQAKGRSARAILRAMGEHGPLWARAFHDRAIRRDSDLLPAARYLVANPLRAGLVDRIGDYPWWDARWLTDGAPI